MVEARLRWVFPEPVVIDPSIRAAADRLGLSPRIGELLIRRGISDAADLESYFGPPRAGLHDARLLPDADAFVQRIDQARRSNETVLVFGDFDADGLTGLAILTLALRRLGLRVETYVPSRIDDGHGLSSAAMKRAGELGVGLIITVDCGTTSHAEIADAAMRGIDVLVTDHHRVPPELPPALAVVNPHRADSRYPDRRLSGSAVAFKVAQLVLGGTPGGDDFALSLADLATIGGVADLAPVLGENRAIARIGLDRVHSEPRPGIAALLRRANVDLAKVDLETIAFTIAPRLNAAGRVGEAAEAARLLLADDVEEAEALADALEMANRTRRDLTRVAIAEARAALELDPAPTAGGPDVLPERQHAGPIVVRGDWPVGIVGLVASRLAEDFNRPAVVGANMGDLVRASCRSDGALDLGATLEACAELFVRYGGHAGAAGFEIVSTAWASFDARFRELAAPAEPADPRPVARIDLALPASAVDYALLRDLANVGPCGPGNPEPVLAILGLTVTRVRLATGGHTQLTLRRVRDVLDAIAFDRPDLADALGEGDRVDVVGRLASRAFAGLESLQIEIQDVAPSGWHAEAASILSLGVAAPGQPATANAVPASNVA